MRTFVARAVACALWLTMTTVSGFGADYVIYGIHKDFPMTNTEKDVRKDFYVNLGKRHGVKVGTELDIVRTITTYDAVNNKVGPTMKVTIGKLKVIYADDGISAARMLKMQDPEKIPVLSYSTAMVGDKVEISAD